MMMKNRAATLIAPRELRTVTETPRKPGPGEALVRVQHAGVCGTDVAIYRGEYPVPLPLVLGHEFVGTVVESADPVQVGARVVCEINNSCIAYGRENVCEMCARGLPTHCLTRTVLGIIHAPGAFAESVLVPAGSLHVLPNDISGMAAVLIEPLAAAIRTFELTPISSGETVVVLGCGRLGRLVALVANKLGARVVAVGRSMRHANLVEPFADTTLQYHSDDSLRSEVIGLTRGVGADVVVEATGTQANLHLAQRLVRPMGTVALKSTSGVPVDGVDTTFAAVQEIRLQGSRCGPFNKAIEFMRAHGLPDDSWITARFALEEAAAAIEAAGTEPKVVIDC